MLLLCAWVRLGAAEGLHALNLPAQGPTLAPAPLTEEIKGQYLSQGQDYLRTYMRESMQRLLAEQGVAIDMNQAQTGAALDLTPLYAKNQKSPLATRLHFWAKDDLQSYLSCGRFLPVKVEMDSAYQMAPRLRFQARLEAPLDDLFLMEVGSSFRWTNDIDTRVSTTLRHGERFYSGVALGVDVALASWRLEMEYCLNPDSVLLQRLTLGTNF